MTVLQLLCQNCCEEGKAMIKIQPDPAEGQAVGGGGKNEKVNPPY